MILKNLEYTVDQLLEIVSYSVYSFSQFIYSYQTIAMTYASRIYSTSPALTGQAGLRALLPLNLSLRLLP